MLDIDAQPSVGIPRLSTPKGTVPVVSPNPPFVTTGTVPFLAPRFYRWHKGKAKAQARTFIRVRAYYGSP
jgi:hypothetical protein